MLCHKNMGTLFEQLKNTKADVEKIQQAKELINNIEVNTLISCFKSLKHESIHKSIAINNLISFFESLRTTLKNLSEEQEHIRKSIALHSASIAHQKCTRAGTRFKI